MAAVSLIVAMDRNALIGTETGLPWRLPSDLKRFRKLTIGKPIILGRRTLEQIGGPLKERLNIVLTRQADFQAPGCEVVHSLQEALARAEREQNEIMVIGGADVYRQALPAIVRIYLTVVEGDFQGNTWFPAEGLGMPVSIKHDERLPADEKNPHPQRFLILERGGNETIRGLIG